MAAALVCILVETEGRERVAVEVAAGDVVEVDLLSQLSPLRLP